MANADARLLNAAADFVTAPASQVGIALCGNGAFAKRNWTVSKGVFAAEQTLVVDHLRFAVTVQIPKFFCAAAVEGADAGWLDVARISLG